MVIPIFNCRWIERVTNCGYKLSIMWECQWDKLIADNDDIRQHVKSYALSTPLVARDALYGGRCENFSLHAESSKENVVKYVDVQSLYPYVCKNKHYPIGHPRCLVRPALQKFGTDIIKFEGIIKCTVLPPRGLHVPLLPAQVDVCTVQDVRRIGKSGSLYSLYTATITDWHLGER